MSPDAGARPAPRRLLSCDRCDASAWIGPAGDRSDAWCEACQHSASIPANVAAPRCENCGEPLTVSEPRFEELYGKLQDLVAVLEAWNGKPARLGPLVPERPRFLSDLDPPETLTADDSETRATLEALRGGAFADARARLESRSDPNPTRLWLALGIARQRLDDLAGAEAAFTHVLDLEPEHPVARLDRGALRARRGDFEAARFDLAQAGERVEAKWNRAALIVLEAVALGTGMVDPTRLAAARAAAGPPSSYWSDHTVGRLLFTLLAERARARGPDACGDARTLRAAERELEFDTFDDRALVLHGYVTLGLAVDAERVAAPLAEALAEQVARQPFARGPAGAFLAVALEAAVFEVRGRRADAARAIVAPLLERTDLRRYRIPCARCGAGTVGVERVEDEAAIP